MMEISCDGRNIDIFELITTGQQHQGQRPDLGVGAPTGPLRGASPLASRRVCIYAHHPTNDLAQWCA